MKQRSKSNQSDNRRYAIGTVQTAIGPSRIVVRMNDIVGLYRHGQHTVEVRQYGYDTIWVSDTDDEVKRLLDDWKRNGGRV